jgi:hypothetical protein
MLGLQLSTDPRWVNIVEKNIEEILVDHAYCEQKAASTAISFIIGFPEKTELVQAMIDLVAEEMSHFKMVHELLIERGFTLGRERKDEYVNQLIHDHPTEQLFSKLSSVETYEGLMPEGAAFSKIDDRRFRFKLGGMPEIGLTIGDKQPNESIVLTSSSDKISFSLRGQLTKISETQTDVQLQFEGDFNPMMVMMVKKPLTQFMESLIGNMHKL